MDPSMQSLIFPCARYNGSDHPEKLAFNANLQEFSQRVTYLCLLQSNGKISSDEVIEQIDRLWNQLERSKAGLHICDIHGSQQDGEE